MENIDPALTQVTQDVFGNDLVWRCLGGYLGPGDLKDCRFVSKTFDKNVRGLTKWKEGMQLHLKREALSDPALLSLVEGLDYGAVKVALSAQGPAETQDVENVLNIFQKVKCLTLEFDQKKGGGFNMEELGKTVASILASCSSGLDALILDVDILAAANFSPVVECPIVIEKIQGLKKLHIFQQTVNSQDGLAAALPRNPGSGAIAPPWLRGSNFTAFLSALAQHMESLEDFFLATTRFQEPFIKHHLKGLLEGRASFLQNLELGEIDAITVEGISALVFPQLTHLSLRISKKTESEEKLCVFLANQPHLHSLTLKIRGRLSQKLFALIKAKSSNFVALKLKCWYFEGDCDWAFLGSLENLREFSLTVPSNDKNNSLQEGFQRFTTNIEDIIASLPLGIRKICIRSGIGSDLRTTGRLELCIRTRRFVHLEDLEIIFVEGAVNDEFLQYIGTKGDDGTFPFPKLTRLHLSHAFVIDHLLGEKSFWEGLQDVYLRTFEIDDPDSSIDQLCSTNIRHLTLRNTRNLEDGLPQIVESNKSLETLTSTRFGIQKAHRLKTVHYVATNDDADSDSDVEPGFEVEQSFDNDYDDGDRGWRDYDDSDHGGGGGYCGGFHHHRDDGHCRNCGDYDYEYDSDFWRRNS